MDELKRALETWKTPEPSAAMDDRVIAAFRRETARKPWWRQWLAARISIPVPVAALLLLLFAGAVFLQQRTPARAPIDRNVRSLVAGSERGASYVTVGDFSGFVPVQNGKVVVERKARKQ